jgi:protease-4
MLTRAREDEQVVAVVIEVSSPGGSMTASDLMYAALKDFKASKKPVVVLMDGVAASGGYYVSCAADEILATRTTITGSIGVLIPLFDVTGLLDKVGIKDETVASRPMKDMLQPTTGRNEEEMQRLQELANSMHEMFVDVVAEGRKDLSREDVEPLASGNIYTAQEAVDNGLIDRVGYRDLAVDRAAKLAGLGKSERPKVVRYGRYVGFMEMLLSHVGSPGLNVELGDQVSARLRNQPLLLWSPGLSGHVVTSE